MERQREILARLQDETRQYVWDLREPARLQGSLADRTTVMLAELRDLIETPVSAALNTGERRLSYVVTAIRVLRISPR